MTTMKKNTLAITHPHLAAQAHGWDPTTITAGSIKKLAWKCERGHIWEARVHNRTWKGTSCTYCMGYRAWPGYNDLATTHPHLAAQAHGWDPTTVMAGSRQKLAWKCEHGHTWDAAVNDRKQGQGCPTCAGSRVLLGYNDLTTTHPHLAAQAHGWDPTTITAGSSKKLAWKCERGHIWEARGTNRKRGQGCPTCARERTKHG